MTKHKVFVLFDADFADDIGNNVPGTAAIALDEILDTLTKMGYEVTKSK